MRGAFDAQCNVDDFENLACGLVEVRHGTNLPPLAALDLPLRFGCPPDTGGPQFGRSTRILAQFEHGVRRRRNALHGCIAAVFERYHRLVFVVETDRIAALGIGRHHEPRASLREVRRALVGLVHARAPQAHRVRGFAVRLGFDGARASDGVANRRPRAGRNCLAHDASFCAVRILSTCLTMSYPTGSCCFNSSGW